MPTIVDILIFISMIKQYLRHLKQDTSLFVGILVFTSCWNFLLSWVEHKKRFITPGPAISVVASLVILNSRTAEVMKEGASMDVARL